MGKVSQQMVEQAGLDLNVLRDKLIAAAGAEVTTFYYYTLRRANAIGLEGKGLKEIIEDARIEDRNHLRALTPRIYELGDQLPNDIRDFADKAGCPDPSVSRQLLFRPATESGHAAYDTSWATQPWTWSSQGREQRAIRRKQREEKDRRV
jgi:hypothetical protein